MKPVYIAAYHQSVFGKLMGATVPEIVASAVHGACAEIGAAPAALDVASIGSACNVSLDEQGLLAGLVAQVPGMAAKPIEAVENACASGGQAVLSVVQKLQLGLGVRGRQSPVLAVSWIPAHSERTRDSRVTISDSVGSCRSTVPSPRYSSCRSRGRVPLVRHTTYA